MGDFAKLLGRFFARDFLYFLGGVNVLGSFLIVEFYTWQLAYITGSLEHLSLTILVPLAGLAYLTGYIVNYLFGLLGASSPADRLVPWSDIHRFRGRIAKFMFRHLNGYQMSELAGYLRKQPDISQMHPEGMKPVHVYALQAIDLRQDYLGRNITIHHFSSVFGSTCAVCALILLAGAWEYDAKALLIGGLMMLLFAIFLCCDSHYRSAQIAFGILMRAKWIPEAPKEIDS